MDTLANLLGMTSEEAVFLVVLAVGGLVVLGLLRFMFRLTANLMRLGCAVLLIVVGLIIAASFLG
jgi:hypothetical protein